ncbi:YitT family protein [Saccharopolyspora rhizosphaerae]|uniref:YitT family protein n=1 Tax=Saccharopolyspora rhizosphaerae TaxID=2492662 RepID=A0A426K0B8_9PSEU|nr:YitT family protein [Saccharopolyspora rhizosphaerae]RRO18885.1 YitT family protein [Saccharopolyspora rhizosphaerae]
MAAPTTTPTRVPTPPHGADLRQPVLPHSRTEDALGLLTGTFVVALGLHLLKASGIVTGGTAGLSLLLSYGLPVPFGVLFFAVNLPFMVLAVAKKGWRFAVRSLLSIALVSAFTPLHAQLFGALHLPPLYAAVSGNVLTGIGLLIVFRHGASLGGFNVVALIAQERFGWRAGYVQMALDVLVIAAASTVVSPTAVLVSAFGAVFLNGVLALNHRPGRYLGA